MRVERNRVKLTAFVLLFIAGSSVLLTAALAGVPGGLFGLLYTFDVPEEAAWYWGTLWWVLAGAFGVIAGAGSLASAVQLANAEDWVRNRFRGAPIRKGEHSGFQRAVEEMAIAAGLTEVPEVIVVESDSVNAYALGAMRSRAVIGVTTGMLGAMTADEQRAVVATLTARIVSGDILFATALAALMGPLKLVRVSPRAAVASASGCLESGCSSGCSGMGELADGCSGCLLDGSDSDSAGGCLGTIATFFVLIVIALITYGALVTAAWLVTLWGRLLHRTAYEKADAEGMLYLKDPAPMLSALRKAVASDTRMSEGDPSYDGIFYAATSGTAAIERGEQRRMRRLAEVLGADGAMAMADAGRDGGKG